MALIPATAAANFFALNYWNYPTGGGSQAGINTPADPPVNSGDIEFHRVVDQHDFASSTGLAQIGIFRSGGAVGLDTCGTGDPYHWQIYSEYKMESTNTYNCQLFSSVDLYVEPTYAVCRYDHGPYFRSWYVTVNGGLATNFPTGFYNSYDMAGAEDYNNLSNDYNRYDGWTSFAGDYCSSPHTIGSTVRQIINPPWNVTVPSGGTFYTGHP